MDGHNEDPTLLAQSLYPNGIHFQTEQQYQQHFTPIREKRTKGVKLQSKNPSTKDLSTSPTTPRTAETIFRALATNFVMDMKHAGLTIDWNKSRRQHWWTKVSSDKTKLLHTTFKPNSRIQFYCTQCMQAGRLGLVANCIFIYKPRNLDSPSTQPQVSPPCLQDHFLHVEEIYYHCTQCDQVGGTDAYLMYQSTKHVILPAANSWVFSQAYAKMVEEIEAHPKAGYEFSKNLSSHEISEIRRAWPWLNPCPNHKWNSFGESINFNCSDYKYDDRSYLLLPGNPLHEVLTWQDHRKCMARLLFVIVCQLGIEEEISPFLFDSEKFLKMWNRLQRKRYLGLWSRNKEEKAHLKLKELSALFGGNERVICGFDKVHQWCHIDGGEDMNPLPDGFFRPASLIVPLCKEGRQIYIRTPDQVIDVPLGKMLIFACDLPHGGVTTRLQSGPQRVAIHGHIDSSYLTRGSGLLDLSSKSRDYYIARQHLMLYDIKDHMDHIIEIGNLLQTKMGDFFDARRKQLQQLQHIRNLDPGLREKVTTFLEFASSGSCGTANRYEFEANSFDETKQKSSPKRRRKSTNQANAHS